MIEPKVFSVGQINRYIKNLLENDFILNSLLVQGEISNFKAHSSGHWYFTLKDAQGAIACVMFQQDAAQALSARKRDAGDFIRACFPVRKDGAVSAVRRISGAGRHGCLAACL